MIWTAEQLAVIDQRIAAAADRPIAFGTVVTADAGTLRATVTFDGSATAVPVKMFGHTRAIPGDRVGLVRYGGDWVATGVMADRWPDDQGVSGVCPSATTTSGTFVLYPGSPSFPFTKRWPSVRVRVDAHCAMYSTVNATTVAVGMRFTNAATAAVTEFHVVHWYWSNGFEHTGFSATLHIPAASLAAGSYLCEPLWAKIGGTGTLTTNADDWYAFGCREIGP